MGWKVRRRFRGPTHGELIRHLWPDKALFGAIMLFVTGLIGVGYGFIELVFEVEYSDQIPTLLQDFPPGLSIALSILAAGCAAISLYMRDTKWAFLGCVFGVLAVGLLGVGSLLALLAFLFLLASWLEKEDSTPETLRLTTDMWPDKTLAASLLLLITGILTLAWALALLTGTIAIQLNDVRLFGITGVLVSLICFFAALELYFQRGLWVGTLACVGGLCAMGFYGVGPLLSGAAFVLIALAWKEREFDRTQPPVIPKTS